MVKLSAVEVAAAQQQWDEIKHNVTIVIQMAISVHIQNGSADDGDIDKKCMKEWCIWWNNNHSSITNKIMAQ